jgi:hypothetical protein
MKKQLRHRDVFDLITLKTNTMKTGAKVGVFFTLAKHLTRNFRDLMLINKVVQAGAISWQNWGVARRALSVKWFAITKMLQIKG